MGGGHRRPAHVCHHFSSRRREDDPDRKAAALRPGDRAGRERARPPQPPQHHLRLDADGTRTRDLDHFHRAPVPLSGPDHQPAGYPRSPGLLRRYLPHARRGRLGRHGAGRRQGHRAADPQAVRSLPQAGHPDLHFHQQAGSPGPRTARTAGRDPDRTGHGARPGQLAPGRRPRLPGRGRPAERGRVPVRPDGAQRARSPRDPPQLRLCALARPVEPRQAEASPGRVGAARRVGDRIRSTPGDRRGADAGVLRQRPDQFRRAPVHGRLCGVRPSPTALPQPGRDRGPQRSPVLGVHLQDTGEHEPQAPRQRGLPAHLLR